MLSKLSYNSSIRHKYFLLCLFVFFLLCTSAYQLYGQSITWAETQPAGNVAKPWETTAMSSDGSKIIAGVYSGRLYISTNGGTSWTETQPAGAVDKNWYTTSMSSDGSKIIAAANDDRLYISTNGGTNWTEKQPAGDFNCYWHTSSMSSDGSILIAGVAQGRLYISTNGGTDWGETTPGGANAKYWKTTSMSSDGSIILAGALVWSGTDGRLWISTNSGSNWAETKPVGNVVKDWSTSSMSSDGSIIIAGNSTDGKTYISTNGGTNWTETQPTGGVQQSSYSISMSSDGSKIIVGTFIRLYISSNGGTNWAETQPAGNVDRGWNATSMSSDGSKVIVGCAQEEWYIDPELGPIMVQLGKIYFNIEPLPVELTSFSAKFQKPNVVTLTWATETEVNNYGFEIERTSQNPSKGVTNQKNWEKVGFVQGNGNSNSQKNYSFIDNNPLSGKVQYRLKQIDNDGKFEYSDYIEVNVGVPSNTELHQNYPNPFNPSTAIKFSLSKETKVKIVVYDILGNVVNELVNDNKPAGNHIVYWNSNDSRGNKVASGVYFYKLEAGDIIQIKKMNLVK